MHTDDKQKVKDYLKGAAAHHERLRKLHEDRSSHYEDDKDEAGAAHHQKMAKAHGERADELDALREAIEDGSEKGAGAELDFAKMFGSD